MGGTQNLPKPDTNVRTIIESLLWQDLTRETSIFAMIYGVSPSSVRHGCFGHLSVLFRRLARNELLFPADVPFVAAEAVALLGSLL